MTKDDGEQHKYDIFVADRVYPDAAAIFSHKLSTVDQVKDDCIVVLDTNVLLMPYRVLAKSLDEIRDMYHHLVQETRLVIPGQVAREFVDQRAERLKEMYKQLVVKLSQAGELRLPRSPLLHSLSEYQEVLELESKFIADHSTALKNLIKLVQGWTWNDPVSAVYADLFSKDVVYDPALDQGQIEADLTWRWTHRIPPGYKDAGKRDAGVGDLLIWHTILMIGETREKSVLFVSGDEKGDWWYRSDKEALYPRFELVDEFRRRSKGHSFHIVAFSRLLDLYGASDSVVEEVRQEEATSWGEAKYGATSFEVLRQTILGAAGTLRHLINERDINSAQRGWIRDQLGLMATRQPHSSEEEEVVKGLPSQQERLAAEFPQILDSIATVRNEAFSLLDSIRHLLGPGARQLLGEVRQQRFYPAGLTEAVLADQLEEIARSL